jgi:hypothetical protein
MKNGGHVTARQKQEDARECEERLHDKADLLAQEWSATAASNSAEVGRALYGWAMAEMAFVIVALGVAYWAARATQESVIETRRIGEEQTKAYLATTSCQLRWDKGAHPDITITHRNGGQTPATDIWEVVSFMQDERPDWWDKDPGTPRPMMTGGEQQRWRVSIEAPRLNESAAPDAPELKFVYITLFYQDVFMRRFKSTVRFSGLIPESGKVSDMIADESTMLFFPAPAHAPINRGRPIRVLGLKREIRRAKGLPDED